MAHGLVRAFTLLLIICIATLWQPVLHRATVLGFFRSQASIQNIHGHGSFIYIRNTIHCEDLHYHRESNKLYTACESAAHTRNQWFPPLAHLSDHHHAEPGRIVVVDPTTFESTALVLSGFTGPLVTHGIDLFPSEDGRTLTIFAVNHLPNLEYDESQSQNMASHKAQSQIEVFSHTIGSDTAIWIRSVRNAAIRTPNDIYATSETSFYVTNDHYYRDGLFRQLEDLLEYTTGAWSDVVHIEFTSDTMDATSGLTVAKGLTRAHNPNGLGHTTQPDEVLLVDASGGDLFIMGRDLSPTASKELTLRSRIQLDTTIDNPSYYSDLYATAGNNASGYILAGLLSGCTLAKAFTTPDFPIPTVVWHVRTNAQGIQEKVVIFQDDGKVLKSASAAVLVGIDPASNGGRKQAWLFVTGFVSEAMIAVKVDL